ncbi:MAG: hypothetical protein ACOX68_07590 [Candidatus Limivicinus sp.]
MKKTVIFVLLFSLLLVMCGCGAQTEAEAPLPAEKAEPAAEETAAPEPADPTPEPTAEPTPSPEPEPEKDEIIFTEQGIIDNNLCSVVITGIDAESMFGYTLNAVLENKTADTVLSFTTEDSSVNGIKADANLIEDLEPGTKGDYEIVFRNKEQTEHITDFTDIKMTFKVSEKDNYVDSLASETVHIYPLGEDKAVIQERQPEKDDITLLDNDKLTVVLTGYRSDDVFGMIADFFITNKMDSTIAVLSEDETVNGTEARPYFAAAVPGGCCSYEKMVWMRDLLEEKEIEKVETVEFRLQACNNKNLFDSYADEPVELHPDFTP